MKKDIEQIHIEFNDKAQESFFVLCQQFEQAVGHLDRDRDDNVFHQSQGKFAYTLKYDLDMMARSFLDKYQTQHNISLLQRAFTSTILRYINEFAQKCRTH